MKMNDISCNYFEDDSTQWQIRVSPVFVNIYCPKKHVDISIDVSTAKNETTIVYSEETEYKCGADVTEGLFRSEHCTLVIGSRRYVEFLTDDEDEDENGTYEMDKDGVPVQDGYADLHGRDYSGFRTGNFLPFQVATIVRGIAQGRSIKELEELGAGAARVYNMS